MRPILYLCLAALYGCTTLPEPDPTRGDCQLRAGAAVAEGSVVGPFNAGGGSYGGAVTMIGTCPPELRVLTRTREGTIVCHGSDEWCANALDKVPLTVTPEQLRQLIEAPEE